MKKIQLKDIPINYIFRMFPNSEDCVRISNMYLPPNNFYYRMFERPDVIWEITNEEILSGFAEVY